MIVGYQRGLALLLFSGARESAFQTGPLMETFGLDIGEIANPENGKLDFCSRKLDPGLSWISSQTLARNVVLKGKCALILTQMPERWKPPKLSP